MVPAFTCVVGNQKAVPSFIIHFSFPLVHPREKHQQILGLWRQNQNKSWTS